MIIRKTTCSVVQTLNLSVAYDSSLLLGMSVVVEGVPNVDNKKGSKSTNLSSHNVWLICLDIVMAIKVHFVTADLFEAITERHRWQLRHRGHQTALWPTGREMTVSTAQPQPPTPPPLKGKESEDAPVQHIHLSGTALSVGIVQRQYLKDQGKLFLKKLFVCLKLLKPLCT